MHYRKKRSREIALKGQSCLKKLRGEEGLKVEQSLKSFVEEDLSDRAASNSDNDEVSDNDSVNFTSSNTHIDMSEDVPITSIEDRKVTLTVTMKRLKGNANFSQKRKTRLSDVVSNVTARANGQESSKTLKSTLEIFNEIQL